MKAPSRMSPQERCRRLIERDADIRQSLKAGATLAELGRKYFITRERVRQIGKLAPSLRRP
jgi:DNA-directed RNA polymerase sigma subunit (sigma70/sigma32)